MLPLLALCRCAGPQAAVAQQQAWQQQQPQQQQQWGW
jgi:hypothetical protein